MSYDDFVSFSVPSSLEVSPPSSQNVNGSGTVRSPDGVPGTPIAPETPDLNGLSDNVWTDDDEDLLAMSLTQSKCSNMGNFGICYILLLLIILSCC